ncbi:MAG: adenylyltransferase/cytidyltransferase family protein [Candidatus Pacebacteria bacterium]|nr:adenylyltransferase/cytidyltransferase family protein [Candidatus Paceibacterota bacterium]MCF7862606.1 adenylyltransferase/cytidyltransferase family protein [Candidatus Paceibacterota bacterium]
MKKKKIVVVSGGFDPVHIGHLRMFKESKKLGDELVVVINNDNWLKSKKGYSFMPEKDRLELISAFSCVDRVFLTNHKKDDLDDSVCKALLKIKPDIFANGGDRKADNIPEYDLCNRLGIKLVFNVGGKKIRSSSELVKISKVSSKKDKRK